MGGRGSNFKKGNGNMSRALSLSTDNLPELEGSEKQVSWGKDIRDTYWMNNYQAMYDYSFLSRNERREKEKNNTHWKGWYYTGPDAINSLVESRKPVEQRKRLGEKIAENSAVRAAKAKKSKAHDAYIAAKREKNENVDALKIAYDKAKKESEKAENSVRRKVLAEARKIFMSEKKASFWIDHRPR